MRKAFCAKTGLPELESFEALLASGADAAIVCTATDAHARVIPALARAGMDVFTEKVLAITDEDARAIQKAVLLSGVRFAISYPHKYGGGARTVKAAAESGELGRINYFRCRNAHNGSTADWLPAHFFDRRACGGGAMIDLGAHGMYLSEWFLGMPEAARSAFTVAHENPKNADGVEDNAVTVMRYASGAVAVNETGFVSGSCPMELEVCGENGWVRYDGQKVEKSTADTHGIVPVPMLPDLPSPIVQFCTDALLPGCGIEDAVRLTRLMVMAYENA